jgi:AcrR family transcriptional regulator
MIVRLSQEEADARQERILTAARWYFLHFGFAKTALDDIAKRAGISRPLLYKRFRDKEAIFVAVFAHWLVARQPQARAAAARVGDAYGRLTEVCDVLVVEPWRDMVGAPMAAEFHDVCDRLDPTIAAGHQEVAVDCAATILGDRALAEVFVLALDGLLGDEPTPELLRTRIALLAGRFAPPP